MIWPGSVCPSTTTTNCRRTHSAHSKSLKLSIPPSGSPTPARHRTYRPTWALWCCGREWAPRRLQRAQSPGSSGCRADSRPCQSSGRGRRRRRSGGCPWPAAATPTPGTWSRTGAEGPGSMGNQASPLELWNETNACKKPSKEKTLNWNEGICMSFQKSSWSASHLGTPH